MLRLASTIRVTTSRFPQANHSRLSSDRPSQLKQWLLPSLGESKQGSMAETDSGSLNVDEYNAQWEEYWKEGVKEGEVALKNITDAPI